MLEEADFGAASILSGSPPFSELKEEEALVETLGERRPEAVAEGNARPRVISVRRANVGHLLLSDADLRGCRFEKAHHLDGLRLEGDVEFSHSPRGLRWTKRRVLAEEHQWRHAREKSRSRRRWYGDGVRAGEWFSGEHNVREALAANSIANIYRDLRKGREESKDEPGAADFYYGEMEMRRFDKTKPRAERLILWLYWLISGYGLRASRALGRYSSS